MCRFYIVLSQMRFHYLTAIHYYYISQISVIMPISYVISIIPILVFFQFFQQFYYLRLVTSSAVVGSSAIRSLGSQDRAIDIIASVSCLLKIKRILPCSSFRIGDVNSARLFTASLFAFLSCCPGMRQLLFQQSDCRQYKPD